MGQGRRDRLHQRSSVGTVLQPQPGTLPHAVPSPRKAPGTSFPRSQGSPQPCKASAEGWRGMALRGQVGNATKEAQSLLLLPLPPERKKRDLAEFTPQFLMGTGNGTAK